MTVAYTSPSAIKTWLGVSDTNHDAAFTAVATAVNSLIEDYIGFGAGSGATAVRTYDGDGTDELFIRGGVQAITTLEIASETGGTFSTMGTAEYVPKPYSHERPSGWPGWRIKLTDKATTYGTFTPGYQTVRITPSGGWDFATTPVHLSRIADILGVRMFQSRQSAEAMLVGSQDFGQSLIRFLPEREHVDYLDHLAFSLGGKVRVG